MGEDKKKSPDASDAALKARLAQLELENRLRLQRGLTVGGDPIKDTPRRGFGSAQGIAHLRHTEYQRRGPSPPPPPAPIPEPGKARFGGTYLQPPLPGIISADATPGNELIPPVPAKPMAPAKEVRARPPLAGNPVAPSPAAGAAQPGQGGTPAAKPRAPVQPPDPAHPAQPAAAPGVPPTAVPPVTPFEAKPKVVAASPMGKAPLPAIYQAGLKAAQEAEKVRPGITPTTPATPDPVASKTAADIVIPAGAEVTKDGPKTPRLKRFKNPTLAPKTRE